MFRVIYQHIKTSRRASERILLSWLKTKFAIIFSKDKLQFERQYTNIFSSRNSYYEIKCSTEYL